MESLCIAVWYKLGFLRTTVSRRAFSRHLLKISMDGSVEPRCFGIKRKNTSVWARGSK